MSDKQLVQTQFGQQRRPKRRELHFSHWPVQTKCLYPVEESDEEYSIQKFQNKDGYITVQTKFRTFQKIFGHIIQSHKI